jgi:hypothetical protein
MTYLRTANQAIERARAIIVVGNSHASTLKPVSITIPRSLNMVYS